MNKKALMINVPNPCTQDWDKMDRDIQGRYCSSCKKNVIDFTGYSDKELYSFFSNNHQPVCGRFSSLQLDRPIVTAQVQHSRLYHIAIAASLTLLFVRPPLAHAQCKIPPITQIQQTARPEHPGADTATTGIICGKAVNEHKEPLIAAVVQVYLGEELKAGTITDYDGNYSCSALPAGHYTVKLTYVGYDTIITTGVPVAAGDKTTINFSSHPQKGRPLSGEVYITGYKPAAIDIDNPSKQTFSRQQINNMPH